MAQIYVDFVGLDRMNTTIERITVNISTVTSDFNKNVKSLDWDIRSKPEILRLSNQLVQKLEDHRTILKQHQKFLKDTSRAYQKLDSNNFDSQRNKLSAKSNYAKTSSKTVTDNDHNFLRDLLSVIAGSNNLTKLISNLYKLSKANGLLSQFKILIPTLSLIATGAHSLGKYLKIGRAIGTKQAVANWAKKMTGLRKDRYLSTAQNVGTRFRNNLTNKTSPFNLKDAFGSFVGKNGKVAAAVSWIGVGASTVFNFFDNKEEQRIAQLNNKYMSNGRVIAETVSETVLGTVAVYGGTAIASAAVGAIATGIGVACPPALVITLASGAIMTGINEGFKAISPNHVSLLETVSDGILDLGGSMIKASTTRAQMALRPVSVLTHMLPFR